MLQEHLHQVMQSVPSCYVNGSFTLAILWVQLGPVVHQEHCSSLLRLHCCTVEERIPRAWIEGITAGPPRYELRGERIVVLADVIGGKVGGV